MARCDLIVIAGEAKQSSGGGDEWIASSLALLAMTGSGPIKRSVMIAGHATSISLEPVFWQALRESAAAEGLPLSALVARIDAERVAAPDPPNLASAIRVWLFERARNPNG